MNRNALVSLVVIALGRAALGQPELPLGTAVDGRIEPGVEFAEYVFDAPGAGILTVAVRAPEAGDLNDMYLMVTPSGAAGAEATAQQLLALTAESRSAFTDDDHGGVPTAEQTATTIPAAGRYDVRVGALEPITFRLVAGFLPFPEAARAAADVEIVTLEPGQMKLSDIEAGGVQLYELTVPGDGALSVITRGPGDVTLMVAIEGEDGILRPVGGTDSDQAGLGASESLVVDVEAGDHVGIVVEAFDTSRYVIATKLAPRSDELRAMIEEALEGPPHPALDQPTPDLTFATLEGSSVRLRDVSQRVIVLDIWATWCPPCVRALPQLQKVNDWATGADHPVAVYAVNSREDPDTVKAFLERHRLTVPVLLDQQGTADEPFHAEAIPTTVVIADGTVRRVFVGFRPDYAEHLQSVIESILAP